MASENSVTLVGNLTRDPELRYTTTGRGVASFGLAVNRRYQQNGEWQEQVSFFNVVAWGDLGENAAASLNKGNRVMVTGRLEQRQYETREGEKRNVVEVIADELGPRLRWAQAQVERLSRDAGVPEPLDGGGLSLGVDGVRGSEDGHLVTEAVQVVARVAGCALSLVGAALGGIPAPRPGVGDGGDAERVAGVTPLVDAVADG